MLATSYKNVVIESFAVNTAPIEVTSASIEDRLAPIYERLQVPFGTLEKVSGVKSRYVWGPEVLPSEAATVAARTAIEKSGIDKKLIGAVISCSVTRDYFEPATASIVHRNLEIPEASISFDVSNACIGFSDGIGVVAQLIESGVIKAGVVVSGECVTRPMDAGIRYLLEGKDLDRQVLLKLLPTFTLGSGGVAYVLCHSSIAKSSHRLLASVARSASEFADLCIGNADYCLTQAEEFNPIMHTESQKLIAAAAKLGGRTWQDASEVTGWSRDDVDHVFCHQVGKQVNEAFYKEMGLDMQKEYTIYRKYGNMISAAMPSAVVHANEEKKMKRGDKVVLTAFGSGLNCRVLAIEW